MQMINRKPHEVLGGFEHFESAIIVAFIAAVGIGVVGAIWTLLLVMFTKTWTRGSANTKLGDESRGVSTLHGSSRIHKWSSGRRTYSYCDRKKIRGSTNLLDSNALHRYHTSAAVWPESVAGGRPATHRTIQVPRARKHGTGWLQDFTVG